MISKHRHAGSKVRYRTKKGKIAYRKRPIHNKSKTYNQLKRDFKIQRLADDDLDGVPNYKDCRPWDRGKQHVQSLWHAGDRPPSEEVEAGNPVYGFSDKEFADAWAEDKGYDSVYQFQTSKYDIDPKQYVRRRRDEKILSDNEYIARDVLAEDEYDVED